MMQMRVLTATLLLLIAGAHLPGEAAACSTSRVFGTRAPLFLLVTAQSDTVRTGPGPVRYTAPAADTDRSRPVFGQLFRLDRRGGDVPPELASALAAGHTHVVLVPHGAACRDVWQWSESAQWTRPGSQILTDARLRERSQWIDGRPTFDVDPGHDAYPRAYRLAWEGEGAPRMTPAEAFAFTQVLPTYAAVERDGFAAYRPLVQWMEANPRLARTAPAPAAIAEAQEHLQPCVAAYDPHPVAGTYRMTVIAGADTASAFFRTDARGYPACGEAPPPFGLSAVRPRAADTARLYVHGAPTEAQIPATNATANASPCPVAVVEVVNQPDQGETEQRWPADFNYLVLARCFSENAGVKDGVEAAYAAYVSGHRQAQPGIFAVRQDGTVTFEQRWVANGRVVLELRGIRASQETNTYP